MYTFFEMRKEKEVLTGKHILNKLNKYSVSFDACSNKVHHP
jgi:hypothetical protein